MSKPEVQAAITFIKYHAYDIKFVSTDEYNEASPNNFAINLGFVSKFKEELPNVFRIDFNLNIKNESGSFELIVNFAATFESSMPINADFLKSDFVKINAPAIAFPYMRAFISTFTLNAGYAPVILPTFNFQKIVQDQDNEELSKPMIID